MNRSQFNNFCKIYEPIQHTEELYWLTQKVEKLNPKIILEIGVKTGGTLIIWNHILNEKHDKNSLLIAIDIQNKLRWDTRNQNIKFIIGDSTRKPIIDKVKYLLQNRKIDFVFIDGGHLEHQVAADYQNYSKFVRRGGLIVFHDIYNIACPGVVQFWEKVRGKKDSIKFNQGIGTIEM